MAIFYRIYDNTIRHAFETDKLGFDVNDPSYIPDEYLANKKFIVLRTCNSLGDWGIISAMPRLLKQKYPDCKVYVPSVDLLTNMFAGRNTWNQWNNPFENVKQIFHNNPWVDGFIDNIDDEVFHDHYRIYDVGDPEIPLVKQMLKFWQFTDSEMKDYLPEIYFTHEEIQLGNEIINSYIGGDKFGSLLLTNTIHDFYDDNVNELLISALELYKDLPFFYYGSKDINETMFNFVNVKGNFKDIKIPLRVQLYIKSRAIVNIGYESGINTTLCRYTNVICTPMHPTRKETIRENYLHTINYLRYDF